MSAKPFPVIQFPAFLQKIWADVSKMVPHSFPFNIWDINKWGISNDLEMGKMYHSGSLNLPICINAMLSCSCDLRQSSMAISVLKVKFWLPYVWLSEWDLQQWGEFPLDCRSWQSQTISCNHAYAHTIRPSSSRAHLQLPKFTVAGCQVLLSSVKSSFWSYQAHAWDFVSRP